MAVISKGQTFATGDQVTALKLNNLADNATFAAGAVDNVSTQLSGGAIIVKDGGVTTAKLNDSAVTTAKITDANVTTAKIADANVTFAKLTDVIDDDTMATASATKLATSESIKAYVDGNFQARAGCVYDAVNETVLYSNGISGVVKNSTGKFTATLSSAAPSSYFPVFANSYVASNATKNYATGARSTSTTTIDFETEDSDGAPFNLAQVSIVAFW